MARGIAYGVGVGPGDPDLMTLKAVHVVSSCSVVAVPGSCAKDSIAYKTAVAAVPELRNKELITLPSPMVGDRARVEAAQAQNARVLERCLDQGKDVACLTLGDPGIYSTFGYIQRILKTDGYRVELVAGVPSYCAVAARVGVVLAEWDEPLHVMPTCQGLSEGDLAHGGSYALMKVGKNTPEVKNLLRRGGFGACAVQRCGMQGEQVYRDMDAIPDDAGYLTTIIAKRTADDSDTC